MLKISNLSKTYKKGDIPIPALQDISVEVNQGEFVSIVGRSGSGKSTLLNLIGGLDTATSGKILFKEKDLTQMKRSELAQHRRFAVGMVFQSFNLIPYRTALENVALALTFGGISRNRRKSIAEKLLSQVGWNIVSIISHQSYRVEKHNVWQLPELWLTILPCCWQMNQLATWTASRQRKLLDSFRI